MRWLSESDQDIELAILSYYPIYALCQLKEDLIQWFKLESF